MREKEQEKKKKKSILLNLPCKYVYVYVCTRNGLDEGREEVMCADAQTIHGL
jgi:hypothetical protein